MGDRDDAVDAQQVVGGEVGDVGRNLAGFNRGDYVGGIDQAASGEVQNPHAVFHLSDGILVNHIFGIRSLGNMDGDIIAGFKNIVQGQAVLDRSGKAPGGIHRDIRIVAVNLHAQLLAALATRMPMAPRPITPSFFPLISGPTKALLPFSTALPTASPWPFRPEPRPYPG